MTDLATLDAVGHAELVRSGEANSSALILTALDASRSRSL
jgi:hypothetical protein